MPITAFSAQDTLSINTIRTLSADVVQKANSGHPGAPMGMAPMAHALFTRFFNTSPGNPQWANRDRFVLSNGHACALQYIMLHLLGFPLSMDDLKKFRQLDSLTPGHPEAGWTPGVELTTGPLGQGISSAVGLAIAQEHLAARFNKPGFELFSNYTYVFLGDGCLQEGVASEACSLAGHLKLGKLIALYDSNHIQIDGDTALGFTEDVIQRFQSYGWHTLSVAAGDSDKPTEIAEAIEQAKKVTDRPSLIKITTTIGFGSSKAGTEKVHGAPLGADDIVQVKERLGFKPNEHFIVPESVYEQYKQVFNRGATMEAEWNKLVAQYTTQFPDLGAEFQRRCARTPHPKLMEMLPKYTSSDTPVATRKLSEIVLNTIAEAVPELVGGSADLTGSNLTRWKTAKDFQHPSSKLGDYSGRYLRFGVREHGMNAICNGLHAYGLIVPFAATFLNFISYGAGASRLSALAHHHVLYIMTHDSIGLGEDGPTHQPIETFAMLRATPNYLNFRPADGNEVSGAYYAALTHVKSPSVIALSRQNVPHLNGTSIEGVQKGGYLLSDPANAKVTLVATGTEVSLAVESATQLESKGIPARVVSMPCWELFDHQPLEYRKTVLRDGVLPVISIEALSVFGWSKYAHAHVGMTTFGASGVAKEVYNKFGINVEGVVEKASRVVAHYSGKPVPAKLVDF